MSDETKACRKCGEIQPIDVRVVNPEDILPVLSPADMIGSLAKLKENLQNDSGPDS